MDVVFFQPIFNFMKFSKRSKKDTIEDPAKRHRAACIIQATWRMYLVREQFTDSVLAATMIQRWWRAKQHRLNFLSVKRFILRVQEHNGF